MHVRMIVSYSVAMIMKISQNAPSVAFLDINEGLMVVMTRGNMELPTRWLGISQYINA
jgi:hypothetical protein